MDTDAIRSRLAEEEALLTLLGRLLYGMPDRDLFARVVEERLFESIPFVDGARARQPQDLLLAWTDACATPFSDSDFEAVRVDYTRLFVGAQKVAAPLWESVHFSRERMVFQERTLQVRAAYRAYNLEVEGFQHEPDDHLASELLFAAHLARIAKESLDAGNEEGFERAMSEE
uniref:TorD/DmsD family molecular chaperone n=1 Tax=Paraeggerthella hominis TaxID=2897351 RepID=UPI003D0C121B